MNKDIGDDFSLVEDTTEIGKISSSIERANTEEKTEFKAGLPFTIDFKRMFEKSSQNRFTKKNSDLEELVRFGVGVNEQGEPVEFKENSRRLEMSFGGEGIQSFEDFVDVLMSVYNSDDANKLTRLGATLMACLSAKPKRILIESVNNGEPIGFEIDGEFKPSAFKPSKKISKNKIIIEKDETKKKKSIAEKLSEIKSNINDIVYNHGEGDSRIKKLFRTRNKVRRSFLEELCDFSTIPVFYNREKISGNFYRNSVIFSKDYKFDDGTIYHVSVPLNSKLARKTVLVKDGMKIKTLSKLGKMETVYSSDDGGELNFFSTPNIIIESNKFKRNISGEVLEDSYFEQTIERIEQVKSRFYKDFLSETSSSDSFSSNKESEAIKKLTKSLFYPLLSKNRGLNLGDILSDLQRNYGIEAGRNKSNFYEKLDEEVKKLLNIQIFETLEGKKLSVLELYDELAKHDFKVFTTNYPKKISRTHQAFDGVLHGENSVKDALILNFNSSSTQYYLFSEIFRNRVLGTDPEEKRGKKYLYSSNLDIILNEYKERKSEERKMLMRKTMRTSLKVGGGTALVGVAGTAGYGIFEYSDVIYEMGVAASNFVADNPWTYITAGSGLAFGLTRRMLYSGVVGTTKFIGKGVFATGRALESMLSPLGHKLEARRVKKISKQKQQKLEAKISGIEQDEDDNRLDQDSVIYLNLLTSELIRRFGIGGDSSRGDKGLKVMKSKKGVFLRKDDDTIFLNPNSTEFLQRRDEFKNTKGTSLYLDILDIVREFNILKDRQAELFVLKKLGRRTLDNVFGKYTHSDESFMEDFERLNEEEREYVCKRIINFSGSSSLDEILYERFSNELESAGTKLLWSSDNLSKGFSDSDSYSILELQDLWDRSLIPQERVKLFIKANQDCSDRALNFISFVKRDYPCYYLNQGVERSVNRLYSDLVEEDLTYRKFVKKLRRYDISREFNKKDPDHLFIFARKLKELDAEKVDSILGQKEVYYSMSAGFEREFADFLQTRNPEKRVKFKFDSHHFYSSRDEQIETRALKFMYFTQDRDLRQRALRNTVINSGYSNPFLADFEEFASDLYEVSLF